MEGKRKLREDTLKSDSVSEESEKISRFGNPDDLGLCRPLPRFGAKLNSIRGQDEELRQRLDHIYDSKLCAFRQARFCDVSVKNSAAGKDEDRGQFGVLNTSNFTVAVTRFSGGFRQHFGKSHYDILTGSHVTVLNSFEAFFLADMGSLEVGTSSGCSLSLQDFKSMLETQVPNFASRHNIFSEIHRSTQLILKRYSPLKETQSSTKETNTRLGETSLEVPPCSEGTDAEVSASDPYVLENIGKYRSELPGSANPADYATEIPPYDFDKWFSSASVSTRVADATYPETLDLAFSCHPKSSGSASSSLFDVIMTDYQQKDIPMNDVFRALADGVHSNSTVYFGRDDVGELSGFAAILADIPSEEREQVFGTMTGKDSRTPKEDPLQLDRLLVERVKHYEPDDQLVAREFNRQPSMRDVAITRKIMSDHDRMDDHEPPDGFMRRLKLLQKSPHERYDLPLTSAQEYGFYQSTSAVTNDRRDIRFNFPRNHTEVTEIPDLFTRDQNAAKATKHSG